MKKKNTCTSELVNAPVRLDTQTIYHANGTINIYPCQYELDKTPITTHGAVNRRGRMTIEESGEGVFRAYQEGTGERFQNLFATENGELYASPKSYYVRLKLSKQMSTCRMLETLAKQTGEICDYIKNNL